MPAGPRWSPSPPTPPGPTSSTTRPSGLSLAEIARRSYGDGATVNEALEEGWKRGMAHSMADGILTQAEETLLRDQLAHGTPPASTGRPQPSSNEPPPIGSYSTPWQWTTPTRPTFVWRSEKWGNWR